MKFQFVWSLRLPYETKLETQSNRFILFREHKGKFSFVECSLHKSPSHHQDHCHTSREERRPMRTLRLVRWMILTVSWRATMNFSAWSLEVFRDIHPVDGLQSKLTRQRCSRAVTKELNRTTIDLVSEYPRESSSSTMGPRYHSLAKHHSDWSVSLSLSLFHHQLWGQLVSIPRWCYDPGRWSCCSFSLLCWFSVIDRTVLWFLHPSLQGKTRRCRNLQTGKM